MRRWLLILVLGAASASASSTAAAAGLTDPLDQWLPSPDKATWTYEWRDASYAPVATREQYTVAARKGSAFELQWTTDGQNNADGAVADAGAIDFQHTDAGLVNLSWTGSTPPLAFPILCADANNCANSLGGSLYMAIWGSRSPTLLEPLLSGASWNSVGGVSSDVSSTNRYIGQKSIVVPAFPTAVRAAEVQSDITQGGALGDPYGSGSRTVWWVRGVGPVRIVFRHDGGDQQEADLVATSLKPLAPPPDADYLPLALHSSMTFRWRNDKHMPAWSTQRLSVSQVLNDTARVDVKSVSGPIRLQGAYVFSTRLSGVTNVSAATTSSTNAKFPALGPRSAPASGRRHLLTPLDFMSYGFNPVLQAYPAKGQTWKSSTHSRDYRVFGVSGSSTVGATKAIKVPAGTFHALTVTSKLTQRGFAYGSGTRTSYFAPGKGLVELVFRHRDGSVSTIQRVR